MSPENFIKQYETALGTQNWKQVKAFIHPSACITFSDGSRHVGKEAIQKAFERNFALIQNEEYSMSKIQWILKKKNTAYFIFDFAWKGLINGSEASGSGIGNMLLRKEEDTWLVLAENLHKLA